MLSKCMEGYPRRTEGTNEQPSYFNRVCIVLTLAERNCCETRTDWFSGMEAGRMGRGTTGRVMVDEIGICGCKYKTLLLVLDDDQFGLSLVECVCVCESYMEC